MWQKICEWYKKLCVHNVCSGGNISGDSIDLCKTFTSLIRELWNKTKQKNNNQTNYGFNNKWA